MRTDCEEKRTTRGKSERNQAGATLMDSGIGKNKQRARGNVFWTQRRNPAHCFDR